MKYRTDKLPKAKPDLDGADVIGSIAKKFQESTVDNKAILLQKKDETGECLRKHESPEDGLISHLIFNLVFSAVVFKILVYILDT